MDSVITALLKRAKEAGLSLRLDGDVLIMRGPKSATSIVEEIQENRESVIEALSNAPLPQVVEMIERLRKGVDWFLAIDKKLWDDDGYPIQASARLTKQLMSNVDRWDEMERLLRKLYEYEGCIFEEGKCPEESYLKCAECE